MMTRALAFLVSCALAAPSPAAARVLAPRAAAPVAVPAALPAVRASGASAPLAAGVLVRPLSAPVAALPAAALEAAVLAPSVSPAVPAAADAPLPALSAVSAALAAPAAPESAPAETGAARWHGVFAGEAARAPAASAEAPVAAPAAVLSAPRPALRRSAPRSAVKAAVPAAAAPALAPGFLGIPDGWLEAALPFAQAGGLVVGSFAAMQAVNWAIGKYGPRFGLDSNGVAVARFVSSVAIWGGAAVLGLTAAGIPQETLLATFGAGGTVMAFAVKDVVGNLVHGAHFLISRPFSLGDSVTIDEVTGTVHSVTLRYVIVRTDQDPPFVYHTYSDLLGKSVTVHKAFQSRALRLKLGRPSLPEGLWSAVKDAARPSLWRPAFWSAVAIAALSAVPWLRGWIEHGGWTWLDLALPWAKAGVIAWLARSLGQTFDAVLSRLADRYGWTRPARIWTSLAASTALWIVAGSFVLNALGVTWASLASSLAVSAVIVGVAVNDYVASVIQAAIIVFFRPFRVGDRLVVGKHEGEVLDIGFRHVVLRKDASSHILLPYAVVKGFRSPLDPDGPKAKTP